MILTPQCVGWLGDILIFGLQQVDYTQRKTTCKARKMTIFFIKFRHFCQNHCTGYHIYAKLKASAHTFCGARFAEKPKNSALWHGLQPFAGHSGPKQRCKQKNKTRDQHGKRVLQAV
jgi:hypothetical protein